MKERAWFNLGCLPMQRPFSVQTAFVSSQCASMSCTAKAACWGLVQEQLSCRCFFSEDWANETFFPTPHFFLKISTLEILNLEDQGALLSDDEIFASRQTGKHTCMALRRYFEAHLAIKLEQVKQSLQRTEGGILVHPQPPYKVSSTWQPFHMAGHFSVESKLQTCVDTLGSQCNY